MMSHVRWAGMALVALAGCQSPYRSDQGALVGGLTGAGVGALVGNAVGSTGAGAAIGAGVGALSGAVIGGELDEIEARNRAQIEAQMGRQVAAGAATIDEVIGMVRAGVHEDLIVTHIHKRGVARPLEAHDLIFLLQQQVPNRVIMAMQDTPVRQAAPAMVVQPAPVVVEHYPYPYWGPPPWPHHMRYHHHCRPGMSWGISVGH